MARTVDSDQIGDILRAAVNIEVPAPEHDLIESGLLDSLALVELVFHIERRFNLKIDLEALETDDLRTLDRIARWVSDLVDGPQ